MRAIGGLLLAAVAGTHVGLAVAHQVHILIGQSNSLGTTGAGDPFGLPGARLDPDGAAIHETGILADGRYG